MPKRKKSKKSSRAMPSLIIVMLTPEEKKKAMKSIDAGKVGFEIEDVENPSIPIVRARNHPVQL
jgi:hypothetical protein